MKIIIDVFDKLNPVIITDEEGFPLVFENEETIPQDLLDNIQEPVIVGY